MRRGGVSTAWRWGLLGLVLLMGAVTACTAVNADHPKTVHMPYQEARQRIRTWCPSAAVRVVPDGVLERVEPDLLYVYAESYSTPARTTPPPTSGLPNDDVPKIYRAPEAGAAKRFAEPAPSSPATCDAGVRNTVTLRLAAKVPSLVGLNLREARALLEPRGLRLDAPRGLTVNGAVVKQQDPAENQFVEIDALPYAKRAVTITVGVKVPDVVGAPESTVCGSLKEFDLGCAPEVVGNGPPPGLVSNQDPTAGTVVDPGIRVRLVVQRVTIFVDVPDVVGLAEGQACQQLRDLKLVCRSDGPPDPGLAATVVAQVPAAGSLASAGSAVTVTMAVAVPDVVGKMKDEACADLERARLTCVPVVGDERGQPGQVTVQRPAARAVVRMGNSVTIEYARGVRVPDVRQVTGDAACGMITSAGLTCRPGAERGGGARTVVGQNPEPDTLVAQGTEVALVLAEPPAGVPLWAVIVAAALLAAAASVAVRQYRKHHPPGPPSVEVVMRPGQGRILQAREW